MRVLVDTNVVLDGLMARAPHLDHALAIFALVEAGRVRGVLGATTVTTVFHLAVKAVGPKAAARHVRALLELFDVASIDRAVLLRALDVGFVGFEDAVLPEAGRSTGGDAIVTRDRSGFTAATLPVFTPDALLAALRGAAGTDGR
ncbi:MAG: PIN domain-containing protein [Trueperaceae bacterium]|nr:PIN domain-containing protein [Trueperaceae bacterium]